MEECRARLYAMIQNNAEMDVEPSYVIPPPLSAREKALLTHIQELPPDDPADWPLYISHTEESIRVSYACSRLYQLNHFFEERCPLWLERDARVKGVHSWRKVFAGRVLAKRLAWCMSRVTSADTLEAQEQRLLAIADALPDVKPCYRQVVAHVLADSPRRYQQMVIYKVHGGDRAWANAVFPGYPFLTDHILEEAIASQDSELACQLVPLMPPGRFPPSVGTRVFDALDAERLVPVVQNSRVRLTWSDALANHRRRETRRLSDPAVRPLPPSFYGMVMEMNGPTTAYYNFHQDVMHALDVLVEMHKDGRISRADLDKTRDRIFAEASSRGSHPSYAYLLEDSGRLVTERFAAAVVPFALAASKAHKQNANVSQA